MKKNYVIKNQLTWWQRIINYIFLGAVFLTMVIPMLNVLAVSLSTSYDSMAPGITLIPKNWSVEGYSTVWTLNNLGNAFKNSSIVAVIATVLQIFLSAMAGYVLIQKELPFRKLISGIILFTMMIPGDLTLMFMYSLNKKLNLLNSYQGLILNGLISGFSIMLMRNYFESVPDALAESGRIDNATELRIFTHIYLPLSLPGLASITFLEFIGKWNSFMIPLVITTEAKFYTLPIVLRQITTNIDSTSGSTYIAPNAQMAAIVITVIPLILLYTVAQRFLIGGLTVGAAKG